MQTQTVSINTAWTPADLIDDELTTAFSDALRYEIDKEIVEEMQFLMLRNDGWTEPQFKYDKTNADIGAWVHTNIRGEYKNLNGKWIFKNGADATAFVLKWA